MRTIYDLTNVLKSLGYRETKFYSDFTHSDVVCFDKGHTQIRLDVAQSRVTLYGWFEELPKLEDHYMWFEYKYGEYHTTFDSVTAILTSIVNVLEK